jgi:uncharacterized protein (TIGR02147 family)
MMSDMKTAPSIFSYEDYRKYLSDWMDAKRATGKGSARWFAKQAGFGAHDIFLLVTSGRRNLSMRSIGKFAKTLALKPHESAYFENLVLYNQAKTPAEGLLYYERLLRHPKRRQATPLEQARLAFFQSWLAPVVFEMVQFPDFVPDAHWIAEQFHPPLSTIEVKKVMETLTGLGLVRVENGRWIASADFFDSGDNVSSLHLYSYHENALEKSLDALSLPESERYFQVTTSAAPSEVLPEIRELAKKFEDDVLQIIEKHQGKKDEVFQLSFQAFPILRTRPNPKPRRGQS